MLRHSTATILLTLTLTIPAHAQPKHEPAWRGFQIIMWQTQTPRQYETLHGIGVTAARIQADRQGETPASAAQKATPLIHAKLRPYIENMATDFYSAYHRWTPHKPPNWRFVRLQRDFAKNPTNPRLLIRRPGLSDSHALGIIENRLTKTVRVYAPYRPIFFNLGDETGIADLSAAWDFGFSNSSLAAMRIWLRQQYGTLSALNAEWGTRFVRWHDVRPPMTTQAMASPDENYAAWSDFKHWMDIAFSRAIKAGTQAIHLGAPWGRSAIEGAQMPGWGGYDYTLLAPAVDVMEVYDAGNNLAIAKSFNPDLVTLTTLDWGDPDALHQAWREFLRGTRGMILWDPEHHFVNADGSLGPDGRRARPFFAEMHRGLGPLILHSEPVVAPIAILYSPASFRIQWMLDHRELKNAWAMRGAAKENEDDAVRAARRHVLRLLARLGLTPRFVSEHQIATGLLQRAGYKMLILPQTLALSYRSADAIHTFVSQGGTLVTSGKTAWFDGHGRRLNRPLLSRLLHSGNPRAVTLPPHDTQALRLLSKILAANHIVSDARIDASRGVQPAVEQYIYRTGRVTLVALLAEPHREMPVLTVPVALSFPRATNVYDVDTRSFLGKTARITVSANSTLPTVLALTETPLSSRRCQAWLHRNQCPSRGATEHSNTPVR